MDFDHYNYYFNLINQIYHQICLFKSPPLIINYSNLEKLKEFTNNFHLITVLGIYIFYYLIFAYLEEGETLFLHVLHSLNKYFQNLCLLISINHHLVKESSFLIIVELMDYHFSLILVTIYNIFFLKQNFLNF